MKVLVNSVPKSGTYLLARLVGMLGFHDSQLHFLRQGHWDYSSQSGKLIYGEYPELPDGQYAAAHIPAAPQGMTHLFIYRDPRDVVVSYADFLSSVPGKGTRVALHSHYANATPEHRIQMAIGGCRFDPGILVWFEWQRQCKEQSHLAVRFEDLIGEKGGGDRRHQRQVVSEIALTLHVPMTNDRLESVCDNLHGGDSRTFLKGTIGRWRESFTPLNEQAFKDAQVDMNYWGY